MEAGSRRGERQIRRAVFDYVESEERAEEEEEERALWGGEENSTAAFPHAASTGTSNRRGSCGREQEAWSVIGGKEGHGSSEDPLGRSTWSMEDHLKGVKEFLVA